MNTEDCKTVKNCNNIKVLEGYQDRTTIEKNLLYKIFPECFEECDRCSKAKQFYIDSEQPNPTEHYDTMTSWIGFACSFLGFKDLSQMTFGYYTKESEEDIWLEERLNMKYKSTDDKIQAAKREFYSFSKHIYTVGNFIPIGYNPQPRGLNDRWDIKMQWIRECFFDSDGHIKKRKDWKHLRWNMKDEVKDSWEKYWNDLSDEKIWKDSSKTDWIRFVSIYCLESYLSDDNRITLYNDNTSKAGSLPHNLDEWTAFFSSISAKIDARTTALLNKKKT